MRRAILTTLGLTLIATGAAHGATFGKSRIAPDLGVDVLNRTVARAQVGRELFSDPWATVTLGSVDVYDVFPYLESRTFQFVSDPAWNRIVYGEPGRSLSAYDGQGQALGPLSEPRGMAVDEQNRVYVADAGNDRIVVLQASTQFDDVQLMPLYEIQGLRHPFGVAYSDGGTPFLPGDDVLYVADTGRNRVVAYAVGASSARQVAEIGELGGGVGRFGGPMAVAVGRADGANTPDVYVADAHSQRIVHLALRGGSFAWLGAAPDAADIVTSLDTDRWGNLYAAAPNRGVVSKFSPDLTPVAELHGDLARPVAFHIPFLNVRDHRAGTATRAGQASGVSVEQWTDAGGLRLWSLGVDVPDLSVSSGESPAARFTLTDEARVTVELADAASGRTLLTRPLGSMPAGVHTFELPPADLRAVGGGDVLLRLFAASGYSGGSTASAQAAFRLIGGAAVLPSQAVLLGCGPNPASGPARIAFALPAGGTADVALRIFDSMGRRVRQYASPFSAGRNEVLWDLRDDHGARVAPGIYFYRLNAGARELTQRLVVVR